MTPRQRKLGIIAHITASIGWFGAVAAFLVLGIVGLTSQDAEMVRGSYLAINLIGRFVIVPLSLASLATGLVQALGTEWGLFRHTWILVKLILTIIATIVLLVKVPLMDFAARRAAETTIPGADVRAAGLQLVIHAAGGLLVLLAITTLSIFKPWGKTRFGRRKQKEQGENTGLMNLSTGAIGEHNELPQTLRGTPTRSDPDNPLLAVGLPLGLKITLAVFGIFVVVFVIDHLAGGLGHHSH